MVRLLLPLLTLLTAAKSPTVAESPSLAESQTPQAAVFIHCALLQRWQDVLDELVWAVHRGGLIAFVTNVVIVAVGADHATSDVRSELTPARYVSGGHERKIDIVFSNESMRRYELPTHTALQQFARSHPNLAGLNRELLRNALWVARPADLAATFVIDPLLTPPR